MKIKSTMPITIRHTLIESNETRIIARRVVAHPSIDWQPVVITETFSQQRFGIKAQMVQPI